MFTPEQVAAAINHLRCQFSVGADSDEEDVDDWASELEAEGHTEVAKALRDYYATLKD